MDAYLSPPPSVRPSAAIASMSSQRARKHVASSNDSFDFENLSEAQCVCRVASSSNSLGTLVLVDTPTPDEQAFLRMPKRFRNMLWVRAGTYVVAELDQDTPSNEKLGGDIVAVLQLDHIKRMRAEGMNVWPARFQDDAVKPPRIGSADDGVHNGGADNASRGDGGGGGDCYDDDDDDDEGLPPLEQNVNRRRAALAQYSDSDSDDDDDDDDE